MTRSQNGHRTINGMVFILAGRTIGLNAKAIAQSEAATKRAQGHIVRVIKVNSYEYMIFQL